MDEIVGFVNGEERPWYAITSARASHRPELALLHCAMTIFLVGGASLTGMSRIAALCLQAHRQVSATDRGGSGAMAQSER